jgi:GH43 family beta-xylosidase
MLSIFELSRCRNALANGLKTFVIAVLFVSSGLSADTQLVHRYSFTTGASDSVGTANGTLGTGTISGGKLITDGTKTGVALPAAAVAGITGPFAIETWYLATAPQGAYHTAFTLSDGTTAQYLIAQPNRDSGQGWNSGVSVRGGGGNSSEKLMMGFPGDVFSDNPDQSPRQVMLTYDGTNFIYYWNGIQALVAPTAVDPGFGLQSLAAKIGINSGSPFNDPSLNGYTTDFRIYNQNLTAEQVALLYARGPDASNAEISAAINPAFANRFTNPLMQGQDPEVQFKDGMFNLVQSDGCNIRLRQSTTLGGLVTAADQIILSPGCANLWAPELHWFGNKWYLYYTLDAAANGNNRVYVAESQGTNAAGPYTIDGVLFNNYWNIDGSVFAASNGQLYFIFSGIPSGTQYILIAPMSSPTTLSGPPVAISTPNQSWELNGTVNEGPFGFTRNGKTFIVYSASGCWTDDYCLGLLTLTGANLLDPNAWTKSGPVFTKQPGAYGPGHNALFTDANGQWWNVYHANNLTNQGCGGYRQIRIQCLAWDANNMPVFGAPVPIGSWISGDTNFLAAEFPLTETSGTTATNLSYSPAGKLVGTPVWMNPGSDLMGRTLVWNAPLPRAMMC